MLAYSITVLAAAAVMAGAVVYESRRQRAIWRRFQEALERLETARIDACTSS